MSCGIEQIEIDDAGRWWPSPDGATALLLPVLERDETVDLVAFHSSQTARWWWRIGCGSMLGADLPHDVRPLGPLRVVSTPLGWVRFCGHALCIPDLFGTSHDPSPIPPRAENS